MRRTNDMDFRDCVDEGGELRYPEELEEILSGGRDVANLVTQMYGMIWFLSGGVGDRVALAERQYKMGILMSPSKTRISS